MTKPAQISAAIEAQLDLFKSTAQYEAKITRQRRKD